MRTIIGILILVFVFLIIIAFTCYVCGLKEALIAWGVTLLLTAMFALGIWLLIG